MRTTETGLALEAQRIHVSEINSKLSFARLQPEWDELVTSTRDEIFYRYDFLSIWVDSFASNARLRILIGRDGEGKLVAVLPLLQQRASLMGAPVRQLSSAANEHSCRFDLVAQDARAAGLAFFTYIASDKTWDVLRLTDVPEGGHAWSLYSTAEARGSQVGTWKSLNSPYIELPSSFSSLLEQLSPKFRSNIRRRYKRLSERGAVTLERVTGGADLEQKLEEGFALEQSSWKGRNGTAISQSSETRRFYLELAREASAGGYLSLYFLRLDGQPVAFHYGLTYGDAYYLLKPAYAEAQKECSPGQLLMFEVLKDCIERGLREFDFLGPDMPWKRDWTSQTREHDWIFIFNKSPYGRLLHKYKFVWLPVAKRMVVRWRK